MANPNPISRPKVRNPATQARIRRDVFWQIGLPLAAVLMVLVSAGVWVVLPQGATTRSPIADVSLILLICPAMVVALVVLALVAGLCVGMVYALRELPYLLKRGQDVMVLALYYTQKYAGRVADVFVSTRARLAAGHKTTQHVWALLDRRRPK